MLMLMKNMSMKKLFYKIMDMIIVGTRFAAQAQNVWDLAPVSPIQ